MNKKNNNLNVCRETVDYIDIKYPGIKDGEAFA